MSKIQQCRQNTDGMRHLETTVRESIMHEDTMTRPNKTIDPLSTSIYLTLNN